MSSTTSPRVPTRLVVTLEDKSLAILSPVTGEVLELCYLPTPSPPPSSPSLGSSHTFLTESHPLSRPSMRDVVYIPSEGFIYCLDDIGDIYVFITSGVYTCNHFGVEVSDDIVNPKNSVLLEREVKRG